MHTTDDISQCVILEAKGVVTFDDIVKGHIIRIDNICIIFSICIESVLSLDGLKYNLLSIS